VRDRNDVPREGERTLRDLDGATDRDRELALQVARDRRGEQRPDRQPARDTARESLHARHWVLGEEIVEPFPIHLQGKCSNCNVVGPHE
jgi:hypothetical protein